MSKKIDEILAERILVLDGAMGKSDNIKEIVGNFS